MKSQAKSRFGWKELAGHLSVAVLVVGLLVLWDPFHLVATIQASPGAAGGRFSSTEAAATMYGLILLVVGVGGLILTRPAWLLNLWRRAFRFSQETWAELRKVQWPTWSEVWTFTVVVLIAITAVAVYIGFWDGAFTWIFSRVIHLY